MTSEDYRRSVGSDLATSFRSAYRRGVSSIIDGRPVAELGSSSAKCTMVSNATSTRYVTYGSGATAGKRAIRERGDAGWVKTFESIPVIEFNDINGSTEERKALAKEVGEACRDVGFFYAKTNIDPQLIESTFKTMEEFFARPEEEKLEAHWMASPACRGYEPFSEVRMGTTTQADLRESFTMGDDYFDVEQGYKGEIPPGTKAQNTWPTKYPQLREALYTYYATVYPFARSLLRIFALALELPEDHFEEQYKFPITGMRALHYPSQEADEDNPSLGAHVDFSSFTLVCQEPASGPALEVLNLNGQWVSAPPIPGATFTVNVGDFLENATNGTFVSTVHRVHNKSGARRLSLPFFFSPDPDALIVPIEGFKEREGAEKTFKPMLVGEHYVKRVLTSRKFHPSALKVQELGIPIDEWTYDFMQGRFPENKLEEEA